MAVVLRIITHIFMPDMQNLRPFMASGQYPLGSLVSCRDHKKIWFFVGPKNMSQNCCEIGCCSSKAKRLLRYRLFHDIVL